MDLEELKIVRLKNDKCWVKIPASIRHGDKFLLAKELVLHFSKLRTKGCRKSANCVLRVKQTFEGIIDFITFVHMLSIKKRKKHHSKVFVQIDQVKVILYFRRCF